MEVEKKSDIKPYQTIRGHTKTVRGIVNLPDGQHTITCSDDASLQLWDRESGACIGSKWRDDEDQAGVVTIALSPNGKTVASGCRGGVVKLWDMETKKVTAKWTGHTDHVWSVDWSADGMHVASGSLDGMVRVWAMESGRTVLGPIKTGNQRVYAVAYSPDSSNIATGGDNGVEIWDTGTGERISTPGEQGSQVPSLAWTSDQKKFIAGFANGTIRIFDTTWEQIAVLEGHTKHVNAISLFQNDRLLASASDDFTVRLWNLDTNLPVGPPIKHQDWVWNAALSADGKFLVTTCWDNNAYVWDTYTILKDSGFEELLSVPNVTDANSLLDGDAVPPPTPPEDNAELPENFFNDPRGDIQSSTIPTNYPPSTVDSDSDNSARIPQADPHTRRHRTLASFLMSASTLLRHISSRFRRSRRNTNQPVEHSTQGPASVHGPADVEVPDVRDDQPGATPRPVQDAIAPPSSSGARPPLARISEDFRGPHPNTNESIELKEIPAQPVISHHEPPTVEVAEARTKKIMHVAASPNPNPASANPASDNPASANPASANPASSNPVDPASANPASANPASADPASANPASANPASTNPASANPASANPASTNPASANPTSNKRNPKHYPWWTLCLLFICCALPERDGNEG